MAGITPMLSSTSLQYRDALDRITGQPRFRWFSWTQPGCGTPTSASSRPCSSTRKSQALDIFVRACWCSGRFQIRAARESQQQELQLQQQQQQQQITTTTSIEKRVLSHYSSARKDFDIQEIVERLTISDTASVVTTTTTELHPEDRERAGDSWTIHDSGELYKIDGWGSPYFSINSKGHVSVHLHGRDDGSDELDLVDLIESLRRRNLQLPMVLRFPEIVQHRIRHLNDCFNNAIAKFSYQRHFQGVFPIKCNHDRYLLEDIVKFGDQCKFGLEAGSKPELLIAIAKLRGSKDALLICNGYKDRVYIESVLLARQLGVNAIIVLEQMEELDMVIEACKILDVRPMVGVRAKLSTKHTGHWGGSSGDKGKFGLTINEIVRVVYTLRKEGMLDCLQLLHFHIGSQIPCISIIKEAMREGSHIFCELALMGAPMQYIDVGGGLGIDYDGSKTQSSASTNYSMQNYANDVVAALVDACILKGVAQPIIISESGRALASHHSVLVFDVLSTFERSENTSLANLEILNKNSPCGTKTCCSRSECSPGCTSAAEQDPGEYLLSTFERVYNSMDQSNFRECYSDAKQFKSEIASLFKLGCLSLEQRAQADALYEALCHRVVALCNGEDLPDELQELQDSLAAVYHINLSVFRSAPDAWAIDQIFPIVPLQRLNEKPTVQATLADLTCDSDGKFDRFIGENGEVAGALPVHEVRKGEAYLMGLFLGGVYQEVMGSAHNLFGGTNIIHVKIKPQAGEAVASCSSSSGEAPVRNEKSGRGNRGGYTIERVIKGQTMEEVMRAVQHVGDEMTEELRREAEDAVAKGHLSVEEAQALLVNYKRSLGSYTYLSR